MDELRLLDELGRVLRSAEGREVKAKRIVETVRSAGNYRWVGIYEVSSEEIAVISWSGPGEPAHPRFPITQGLSGTAVSSGEAVVVGDVTTDSRYLTAFGSTRSEIIIPVIEPATRKVVGTIDVESEHKNAFTDADRATLERCAAAIADLFRICEAPGREPPPPSLLDARGGTSGGLGKLGCMDAREKVLTGGHITQGVVRIGNTVRRPTGPHTPFVHSLLRYLEESGFEGAPRVLGIDEQGREILTFIEGYVPPDLATWSDEQLVRTAELIRRFHDAAAGSALAGEEEVVCHNDLSPCNTVFVKGMPSAFIDFDEAAPGSRSKDLGYALWLFLDLGAEDVDTYTQGRRIRMMCDAYGLDDGFDAIGAIAQSQRATLEMSVERLRSSGSESTVAYARDSVRWIRAEMAWLEAHWNELEAAMG